MSKIRHMIVTVVVPHGVTLAEAREYVMKELRAAGGCRQPEDPLFDGLNVVECKPVKPNRPQPDL